MGSNLVTVHSLQNEKAFMHVRNEGYGFIDVWTSCYNNPLFVARYEMEVHFISFSSREVADEYFSNNLTGDGWDIQEINFSQTGNDEN